MGKHARVSLFQELEYLSTKTRVSASLQRLPQVLLSNGRYDAARHEASLAEMVPRDTIDC